MPWQGSACSGLGIFLGCQVAGAGRNADGFPRQLMFLFSFYFFWLFIFFLVHILDVLQTQTAFLGGQLRAVTFPEQGGSRKGSS